MALLQIQLLGTFQVLQARRSLTDFRSDKIRALLIFLAVESDLPHRRDALATLLWPEMDDQKARDNLRLSLFRLRKALGSAQSCLQADRHSVQFYSAQCEVDVHYFSQALTALHLHSHDRLLCAQCIGHLEQAATLYRGDFLPGFFLDEDLLFGQWVVNQRERLHQQALNAFHLLTSHYEKTDRYSLALTTAHRQLELEPWREEAHRQLMALLAKTGQRAGALAQYQTCCRILRDELGIMPDGETQTLYERIRIGDVALNKGENDPGSSAATSVQSAPILASLPVPATPFLGRKEELATLSRLFADPGARLITLVAAGGMGKTRLALEASRLEQARTPSRFPNGIFFVSLTSIQHSHQLIPTIAQALGLQLDSGDEKTTQQDQLLAYLSAKQILLVLDNFEQLLNDQASLVLIANCLRNTPSAQWLITSRERLRLQEEFVVPLAGLNYPETVAPTIEMQDALQLFWQAATRLRPQFDLDSSDWKHVIDICRQLEGMPLGIELAATWAHMLPVAEIAKEIRSNLDFLTTNLQNVPARHRSMRAVFDTTWVRLSETERTLFRRLTLFRGGFTRAAVQQIVGWEKSKTSIWRTLSALVSKSLLQYEPKLDRYKIHELLRQYGQELLDTHGETMEIAGRFLVYYCGWLTEQSAGLKGARQKETLAAIEVELDNCLVAWNLAVGRVECARLLQALFALGTYLARKGRYQEGETIFASAMQQLARLQSPEARLLAAQLQYWRAVFTPVLEQRQELLLQALSSLEALPADQGRFHKAAILMELGSIMHAQGDNQRAEELYEKSLVLHRISGDPWGEANALFRLGVNAWSQGQYTLAEQRYSQSLQTRRSIKDDIGAAQSLEGLSGMYMFHGFVARAIDLARQSLAIYRQLDDKIGTALLQAELGHKLWCQRLEGLAMVEDSLQYFMELGARNHIAHWTVILAMYKADVDIKQAERLAESGLLICREIGYQRGVAIAHGILSRIAWLHEDYARAQSLAQVYLRMTADLHLPLERSDALTWSSWAYLATGELGAAKRQLHEVLRTVNLWRLASLDLIAVILSRENDSATNYEHAWQLIGHSQKYYARNRGAVSLCMQNRFMPEAMRTMSPETIAAAKLRGSRKQSDVLLPDLLRHIASWSAHSYSE